MQEGDGQIDGDDYFRIDAHVGQTGAGYANGDFNYDGLINGDDYFLIDHNFNKSTPALGATMGATLVETPALFPDSSGKDEIDLTDQNPLI